ncbi:MAG: uroporphyrinogen decarboxylase family protein [Spirochaetota bacterium]
MTSRERLQKTLRGEIPDCVPVAPDFSNMVPARLTGKPFWDLYLYNDIPIWEAYIACAKHFNIDSLMDGYFPLVFEEETDKRPWESFIVFRNDERIVTQRCLKENGKRIWADYVSVYYRADSPTGHVAPEKIDLPATPTRFEPVEGVKPVDRGPEGLKRVKKLMGDQGLVGVWGGANTPAFGDEAGIYRYYDNPDKHEAWAEERVQRAEARMNRILALEERPDFICVGGSGTLVFNTVEMVRKVSLPSVKRVIEMATKAGIPTHVHSCGPEAELVKLMAEETGLTIIDPLEIAPMGDCDLKELKRKYGKKLTLKGNLHTTDVMLKGSKDDVIRASKKAIDDAAEGGRFVLSTGDQCGRDTPFENLHAMVETARTYGKY